MSSHSVFDRLSTTPTRASSTRDEQEKRCRMEREQLAAKEAALSSPRAMRVNPAAVAAAASPLMTPKRTSKQQDEFFGRIYKHETACSLAHHYHAEKIAQDPSPTHHSHQLSYSSKPPSPNSQTNPEPSPMKLVIKAKSSKSDSSELDLSTHSEVRISLQNYSAQKLSARSAALSIVDFLFQKEYTHAPHWEVYPATAEQDHDLENVFHVEKKAVLDWKGSLGVKTVSARVRFLREEGEALVEDYCYFVAG
eukprot:CCRYP_000284-RA/>CCRYP_000284-RA protein AED:0.17 eAED:0.17 QI:0/-1/0/1/-1/1/1/0/250